MNAEYIAALLRRVIGSLLFPLDRSVTQSLNGATMQWYGLSSQSSVLITVHPTVSALGVSIKLGATVQPRHESLRN